MRKIININQDWYFSKELNYPQNIKKENMKKINLPHTWNNFDGQDGGNDYYRGRCVYLKVLDNIKLDKDQRIYLEFNGSNMVTNVLVNLKPAMNHKGGYSTFRSDITDLLSDGKNTILVFVDNSESREVYPQKADFTFYGGIYRDVNLIYVHKNHFELDYFGSKGLKITPNIDGNINIEAYLNYDSEVELSIFDKENNLVISKKEKSVNKKVQTNLLIKNVHLWNGVGDPYLYKLVAKTNNDETFSFFGVRSFKVDPNKGFILNNKEYPLIGVSRHQDYQGVGYALTKEMHEKDIQLILEMGANSIRLAHYQHDQYFYDLCDKYGLIIWAEIPYISEHMEEGNENTVSQLSELIIQNYNHPSIITWGLSNEITVTGGFSENLYKNHQKLNDLAHKLDNTRPTTMANLFMLETNSPLVKLPDLRSYNLYYGWYVGEVNENDSWFDNFHQQYPDLAIGLSEFGADANPAYQAENPHKGDYTESYQALYHEHMLTMRSTRPFIWSMFVWNMFDFAADGRDEGGKKGINQKGLVTFDRQTKKDAFYIYKAYLSKEKFVHLCGKRYVDRENEITKIKVYSNLNEISLYVDNKLIETKKGQYIFEFNIKINGEHNIKAVSNNYSDSMTIRKVASKNKDYISPTQMEVVNWFDIEKEEYKEGYFSIKDKVKDIKSHPVAGAVYNKMMQMAMSKMGDVAKNAHIPPEMQEKMDNMTLEANLKMAGHLVSPDMIKQLNDVLQGIKK